jgi:hypothetical protein
MVPSADGARASRVCRGRGSTRSRHITQSRFDRRVRCLPVSGWPPCHQARHIASRALPRLISHHLGVDASVHRKECYVSHSTVRVQRWDGSCGGRFRGQFRAQLRRSAGAHTWRPPAETSPRRARWSGPGRAVRRRCMSRSQPTAGFDGVKSTRSAAATATRDFTAQIVLRGREPETRYWYRVWFAGAGGTGRSEVTSSTVGHGS